MADYRDYEWEAAREKAEREYKAQKFEEKKRETFTNLLMFLVENPQAREDLRRILLPPDVVE